MVQKTIAIIHRDGALARMLDVMSGQLGYNPLVMIVNGATTPQQVSSFVDANHPDLVLLAENYQMDPKRGEGIDALVQIRGTHPRLPVFMVSGGQLYQKEAMQDGANGYLQMPIGLSEYLTFLQSNI